MAKTASKTPKKSAPKDQAPPPPLLVRVPIYGERVRRSGSDMEYEITYVSPDNTYVNVDSKSNVPWEMRRLIRTDVG